LEKPKATPEQVANALKAKLLRDQLRFRLKEAQAQRGGHEAFVQWLQSDSNKNS
jgi:hypothetical protein